MRLVKVLFALTVCVCVSFGCILDACPSNLQPIIDSCDSLTLQKGVRCFSDPLSFDNRSNFVLNLEEGSSLKAGPKKWFGTPFISAMNVTNFTITGTGLIDGSGELWWTGNNTTPGRPILMTINGTDVTVSSVSLLNAAFYHLVLAGKSHVIDGISINSPNYLIAPNTDGIQVGSVGAVVRNVFVKNGDDSIVVKTGASNVLIEDSTVEQGNGLVIGTGYFTVPVVNITFRRCVARNTLYGAHIKFKHSQQGKLQDVLFEDIHVENALSAAIEICQQGQNCAERPVGNVTVNISDVTYRNITGTSKGVAGRLWCSSHTPCTNIDIQNFSVFGAACSIKYTSGTSSNVIPPSCMTK